jgi:hypothetical protein
MTRVRPALPSDLEAIRAVSVRNGLSSFDPDETRESWLAHPFREQFEGVPHGWVLESETGEVVGTFSNIHMLYELEGRQYKAGVAGSWAVDVEHRNASLRLATAYFGQKGVDFCINGSASAVAARLMTAMKAQQVPSPDYDLSYFWLTNRRAFAAAALRKKKIPAAGLVSRIAALGLWAMDLGASRRTRSPAGIERLNRFGPESDAFWDKLRKSRGRLRALRNSAALEWRFRTALDQKRAVALGLWNGSELRGYVVLRQFVRPHLGLKQFVIADLQALDDSPEVIRNLWAGALQATSSEGMDALEWQGWHLSKRQMALSLNPRSYRYGVWPLYYKPVNPDLASTLAQPDVWDFSPFDVF